MSVVYDGLYEACARARVSAPDGSGPGGDYHAVPQVSKRVWTDIQAECRRRETDGTIVADSHMAITLRLDGVGFSSKLRQLRGHGEIGPGYSARFAQAMCATCKDLMQSMGADVGYTQSDEFVLVTYRKKLPAIQPHLFGGRVMKLVSIAASRASLALKRHFDVDMELSFDCRLAAWEHDRDADAVVLWRAYDCGVNGITDACYHAGADGDVVQQHSGAKLQWLRKQRLLPLPPHQEHGTCFKRTRVVLKGVDYKTGEPTTYTRPRLLEARRPVRCCMTRTGVVF